MNLQMDPLCDPRTTRPIQTGWEFTMEPYLSGQFGFIDDPDRQFGNGSVWTRTPTQSDGQEPLLTLFLAHWEFVYSQQAIYHNTTLEIICRVTAITVQYLFVLDSQKSTNQCEKKKCWWIPYNTSRYRLVFVSTQLLPLCGTISRFRSRCTSRIILIPHVYLTPEGSNHRRKSPQLEKI